MENCEEIRKIQIADRWFQLLVGTILRIREVNPHLFCHADQSRSEATNSSGLVD